MLLRFAKIAGGLRLLIAEAVPLAFVSVGVRSVAYLVGFGLSNIASAWLPIVAVLVSVTGLFGAGANTSECEAFRAQMRAIDNANRVALEAWQTVNKAYFDGPYATYQAQVQALAARSRASAISICSSQPESVPCTVCVSYTGTNSNVICLGEAIKTCNRRAECEGLEFQRLNTGLSFPKPPAYPILQTYPACSSPNCPPGKKVWVQVLWASPAGNFSDSKGCFLVAYSQDAPTLPPNIEYNPFLPKEFVESRAISYYLVDGDRFRGLRDNDWKNLESVSGWDKGYWKAEHTDSECRGWQPGWSRKIK